MASYAIRVIITSGAQATTSPGCRRDDANDPTGATYGDIDPALHTAADAVTNWPTGDLFPNYGLPSRYQRRVYLPLIRR